MKMDIKRNFFGLLLLAYFSFVLVSCSGDSLIDNGRAQGDEVNLSIKIELDTKQTPDLPDPGPGLPGLPDLGPGLPDPDLENVINSVRVLISTSTESVDEGLPPGLVLINNRYENPSEIPALRFSSGLRNVYVVANETEIMRAQLDKVTSVSQLHAINVRYDPDVPSVGKPFVMCAETLNKQFEGGTTESLSFDLLRIAAKAHFTVKFDASATSIDPMLKDRSLVVDSVKIMQISDSTILSLSAPVYSPTNKLESHALKLSAPDDPQNWTITGELYLTERLFGAGADTSDPELATHMMLYTKLNGTKCRYRINIGDVASKDDATKDYTITRNTQYNITGTITKVGEMDGVDVVIEVAPWNKITGNSELGDYIYYSRITNAAGNALPSADGGGYEVDVQGETIIVYCRTNLNGWYARTYRDGTHIHTSGTAGASSSNEQYVYVYIPQIQDKRVEYKVNLYHPDFAPENVGPFETLILNQGSGFIPNSVLSKSFTVNGVSYKGWPTNKLPPRGLQIAKQGNLLPDDDGPSMYDPIRTWSTELVNTYTDSGCGFGKSNTDKLLALGATKYPAANLCKALGDGWYLPSRDELLLIYANKDLLWTPFEFSNDHYWSSTQVDNNRAWEMTFYTGIMTSYTKNDNNRVRCIKDI